MARRGIRGSRRGYQAGHADSHAPSCTREISCAETCRALPGAYRCRGVRPVISLVLFQGDGHRGTGEVRAVGVAKLTKQAAAIARSLGDDIKGSC